MSWILFANCYLNSLELEEYKFAKKIKLSEEIRYWPKS